MIAFRLRLLLFLVLALLLSDVFVLRAQMSPKTRHRMDSLYEVAQDNSRPDSVRMKAFNSASYTVYKDVTYGLQITAAYAEAARSMKLPEHEMSALSFMGMGYLSTGKVDSAAICFSEELQLASEHNNLRKKSDALTNLGLVQEAKGNLDSAMILYNQSLENSSDNNFYIPKARVKINIGHIYELQGNYMESMRTYQEAFALCVEHKLAGFYPSVYISLGEINRNIGEDSTAERYFRLALNSALRNYNHGKRIEAMQKIGLLYEGQHRYDSAMAYYSQSYVLAEEQEMTSDMASIRIGMASVLYQQDSVAKALMYVQESIRLYETSRIIAGSEEAYLLAGEIESEQGYTTQSIRLLTKGYELAVANNNVKNIARACKLLYAVEHNLGNDKAAIKWFEDYDSISKILADQESVRAVMKMQIGSEFKQQKFADSVKRAEELFTIENAYRESEAEQERRFYYAAVAAAVLLILFLAGSVFYRQKRKAALELEEKNILIEQALKDKDVLLREVNHRVKNNMQVVSSLLELKSRNASSDQAREALLDSHARLSAMQLAHQKMYMSENYEEIEVIEYCREIAALLLRDDTYGRIQHDVEGSSLFIHVEQAQALGFILHELISNSVRHAWDIRNKNRSINIVWTHENKVVKFVYVDNGKGLPLNFNPASARSFGMRLVYSLVERQLLGTMKVVTGGGAQIIIEFPLR